MSLQATLRFCGLLFFCFPTAAKENLEAPSFQPGILYRYRYSLHGQLNYLSRLSLPESKFWAEALVDVHLLWRNTGDAREQLLHLKIHDLQVHHDPEYKKNQTINNNLTSKSWLNTTELHQPLFVHWNNGKVEGLYDEQAEKPLTMELKRGLISLFQFQTKAGTVTEEDISGNCQVTYSISEASILKTKELHSCIRQKSGFSSVNKIFGILWQPTSKSHYSMKGSLIKSVLSEESHIVHLTLKSSIGVNITSRQHLELVSQEPGSKEVLGKGMSLQEALLNTTPGKPQSINIASDPFKRPCTGCPTLKNYLKMVTKKKVKMDVAKVSTNWKFQKVVQMLRGGKKRDILLLLKKAPMDIAPFYVEAAVTAQSAASLMALSEFLDLGNPKQTLLLEKFFYAAAFSPQPSKDLLRLVLDKLNGKKPDVSIWETGNIVIGSLVGKLCQMKLCGLEVVRQGIDTILKRLDEAKSDSEKVVFLLSLSNAMLPEAIPTLLRYAEEGSASVSAAAVSTLQRYPAEYISSTVKMAMKRVFFQIRKRFSKISRLTAAEILLDSEPSPVDFTNILLATRELDPEMSRFLFSKIQRIIHSHHHPTWQVIKEVLKDPQINNYNILSSQIGSSVSVTGPLSDTNDVHSSFGLELLFSASGLLRKSVTSFDILSHGHHLQAAQIMLEAKGFESFLGGGTDVEDEYEIMAGMSATLLDVQLRPVTFFQGYTDLMSKFFSSSGEPTNVAKGNILLMDHQQAIPLQSGLQAMITLQGGLGLDVSADIDINMWEQELKTSTKTRGALTIDFQAEMDAQIFQATIKSQTEVEMASYFNTMTRLSDSPILMCLQLTDNPVSYRELFLVSESSEKNSMTVRKGRRVTIPGRELPLHRANSEMCRILLGNQ